MTTEQQTDGGPLPSSENGAQGKDAAIPCVGIFWFVIQSGRPELLTCHTPWPEAEDYSDFKTEAMAH